MEHGYANLTEACGLSLPIAALPDVASKEAGVDFVQRTYVSSTFVVSR